jgi:hypothetical protein
MKQHYGSARLVRACFGPPLHQICSVALSFFLLVCSSSSLGGGFDTCSIPSRLWAIPSYDLLLFSHFVTS